MPLPLLTLRLTSDDYSRIPGGNAIRWNVPRDDRAGSDDGAVANDHTFKDDALCADENVITDEDRLRRAVIAAARSSAHFGVQRVEVMIENPHIAADVAVPTNLDLRAR